MKRIHKKLFLITSLVVLLPLFLGLILWNRLPDVMTTHWNAAGEADGYVGKAVAVFFAPLFLLFMHAVCVGATMLEIGNEKQSHKALYIAYWAMPLTSLYAGYMIYGAAFGVKLSLYRALMLLLGIIVTVAGNYLPKCTPNRTVGIRISWTLKDADNWRQTHRFAGKVWLTAGLILLLCVFLPEKFLILIFVGIMAVITALPLIYSYYLHKKKQ